MPQSPPVEVQLLPRRNSSSRSASAHRMHLVRQAAGASGRSSTSGQQAHLASASHTNSDAFRRSNSLRAKRLSAGASSRSERSNQQHAPESARHTAEGTKHTRSRRLSVSGAQARPNDAKRRSGGTSRLDSYANLLRRSTSHRSTGGRSPGAQDVARRPRAAAHGGDAKTPRGRVVGGAKNHAGKEASHTHAAAKTPRSRRDDAHAAQCSDSATAAQLVPHADVIASTAVRRVTNSGRWSGEPPKVMRTPQQKPQLEPPLSPTAVSASDDKLRGSSIATTSTRSSTCDDDTAGHVALEFRQEAAAERIQLAVRGWLDRRQDEAALVELRKSRQTAAAIRIQKAARAWSGRRQARGMMEARSTSAAIRLQCATRSFLSRQERRRRECSRETAAVQNQRVVRDFAEHAETSLRDTAEDILSTPLSVEALSDRQQPTSQSPKRSEDARAHSDADSSSTEAAQSSNARQCSQDIEIDGSEGGGGSVSGSGSEARSDSAHARGVEVSPARMTSTSPEPSPPLRTEAEGAMERTQERADSWAVSSDDCPHLRMSSPQQQREASPSARVLQMDGVLRLASSSVDASLRCSSSSHRSPSQVGSPMSAHIGSPRQEDSGKWVVTWGLDPPRLNGEVGRLKEVLADTVVVSVIGSEPKLLTVPRSNVRLVRDDSLPGKMAGRTASSILRGEVEDQVDDECSVDECTPMLPPVRLINSPTPELASPRRPPQAQQQPRRGWGVLLATGTATGVAALAAVAHYWYS
eukprot:TRINITY_DN1603_c0_g1_i1.p1 TRINITY_DN1603_c0_g1~~TRINITY_DN1603_c0_g1_i1.p1  ORF type:complete len:753 (+),score=104.29 TRINITY_DN1603_c0_g1_i1:75-2333(+)